MKKETVVIQKDAVNGNKFVKIKTVKIHGNIISQQEMPQVWLFWLRKKHLYMLLRKEREAA